MITKIIDSAKRKLWIKHDIHDIKVKLTQCESKVTLTSSQISDIDAFWRKITGKSVPHYWHEYFYSRNGLFSEKYVPTCLYHSDIIFQLNYRPFANAYVDKNLYDIYFPDVLRPKTIIKNSNGFFSNGIKSISKEEAFELCKDIEAAVIKPSLEGMWGRGVRVFSSSKGIVGEAETISQLLNSYNDNYIVQEKICQHPNMAKLNPTSLNTLRILSFRKGTEVYIIYAVVRIGRKGKFIDNETAGGINANVDLRNGCIDTYAYGTPKEKRMTTTDCGTVLKGFEIPSFFQVLDIVKNLHLRLPYFQLIGWDFGINEEGMPVMIEWNRAPDLSQTAHGPAFGEMTEEIFKEAYSHQDSYFIHLY